MTWWITVPILFVGALVLLALSNSWNPAAVLFAVFMLALAWGTGGVANQRVAGARRRSRDLDFRRAHRDLMDGAMGSRRVSLAGWPVYGLPPFSGRLAKAGGGVWRMQVLLTPPAKTGI